MKTSKQAYMLNKKKMCGLGDRDRHDMQSPPGNDCTADFM